MERLGNLQSLIFSKMSYGGDMSVARKADNQTLFSRRLGGKYGGTQHFVRQESTHRAPA